MTDAFDLMPPGPGVALWRAVFPLPTPWYSSTSTSPQLICDLCEHWTDELWPLSSYPPADVTDDFTADDHNAGDMFVCRLCAESIRPPLRVIPIPALAAGAEV